MPLVDVKHARNTPEHHGFMGRYDVRSVLVACDESMSDGAEALLIRGRLPEIRICG